MAREIDINRLADDRETFQRFLCTEVYLLDSATRAWNELNVRQLRLRLAGNDLNDRERQRQLHFERCSQARMRRTQALHIAAKLARLRRGQLALPSATG